MTTDTLSKEIQLIGSKQVPQGWTNSTVHEVVTEWNWNCNIFEIYDQVKEWDNRSQKIVLEYAYHFFGKDNMINELASFLLGWGFDD